MRLSISSGTLASSMGRSRQRRGPAPLAICASLNSGSSGKTFGDPRHTPLKTAGDGLA
jgi:hypothetical protein